MAESFRDAVERAMADARALVRYVEGLGSGEHASPAAIGQMEGLADRIESTALHAAESNAESAANAAAYHALEGIDAFRAAARGNDMTLIRAVAHEILDHLNRAVELGTPSGGGE